MANEKKMAMNSPKDEKPQITIVDSHECFGIVNDPKDAKKLRIVVGNHCASAIEFDSVAAAKKYIDEKPYELIMAIAFEMAFNIKDK